MGPFIGFQIWAHQQFYNKLSIDITIILNLISNKLIFGVMGKFHTGQSAPSTGDYHFAGHMENSACQPTENEKRIPLTAGEIFPPCRHCKTGAFWEIRL